MSEEMARHRFYGLEDFLGVVRTKNVARRVSPRHCPERDSLGMGSLQVANFIPNIDRPVRRDTRLPEDFSQLGTFSEERGFAFGVAKLCNVLQAQDRSDILPRVGADDGQLNSGGSHPVEELGDSRKEGNLMGDLGHGGADLENQEWKFPQWDAEMFEELFGVCCTQAFEFVILDATIPMLVAQLSHNLHKTGE